MKRRSQKIGELFKLDHKASVSHDKRRTRGIKRDGVINVTNIRKKKINKGVPNAATNKGVPTAKEIDASLLSSSKKQGEAKATEAEGNPKGTDKIFTKAKGTDKVSNTASANGTAQIGNDGFSSLCILQIMNRLEEGIKKDLNRFYEELQKPAVGNTSNDSNSNNDDSQEDNSKDDYEANDELSSALHQNIIDVKCNIKKRMKEIVNDHMKLFVPNTDKDEKKG